MAFLSGRLGFSLPRHRDPLLQRILDVIKQQLVVLRAGAEDDELLRAVLRPQRVKPLAPSHLERPVDARAKARGQDGRHEDDQHAVHALLGVRGDRVKK